MRDRAVLVTGGSRVSVGFAPCGGRENGSLSFFQGGASATLGAWRFSVLRRRKRTIDHVTMNRGILFSRPGDHVYCETAGAEPALMHRNAEFAKLIYARAGIETGSYVPVRGSIRAAMEKASRSSTISSFLYEPMVHRYVRDRKLLAAVKTLYNKNSAMKFLADSGIPVPRSLPIPPGPWFLQKRRLLRAMEVVGFPCYLKVVEGSAGLHVRRVENPPQGLAFARQAKYRLFSFQVQEYVPGDSGSVLYKVAPGSAERLLVGRQVIKSGHRHAGNEWPAKVDPALLLETDRAAEACRQLGYLGLLGIDVNDRIIEVNARTTGSAFLQAAIDRIPGIERVMLLSSHRQEHPELETLPLGDLWFQDGKGLLPLEWHGLRGHISVLVVNDRDGSIEDRFINACPSLLDE